MLDGHKSSPQSSRQSDGHHSRPSSFGEGLAPALALNADFRPLSYFPLSLWSWQDTVKAVFLDRVTIISEYDSYIHSPSISMRLPSVIALKDYVQQSSNPAFTRFNVFLRDKFCSNIAAVSSKRRI